MEEKQIKMTKDYSLFRKLEGNRGVNIARINKIRNSIKNVGYVTSPILVNEKMEIIDGQGRLEALKSLNLPVEYIVQEGLSIKECVSMNINQTNWNMKDYIRSYADRGNENYIKIVNLMDEFYFIKDIAIYSVASKGVTRFDHYKLRSGNLIITDEEYNIAKLHLSYIEDIYRKYHNIPRSKMLFIALLYCCKFDDIDTKKLKSKIIEHLEAGKLPPIPTVDEAMRYIEEIYNFNSRTEYVFIYTKYRKYMYDMIRKGSKAVAMAYKTYEENNEDTEEKKEDK